MTARESDSSLADLTVLFADNLDPHPTRQIPKRCGPSSEQIDTALPVRNIAWPELWFMTLATTSLVIAAPVFAQPTALKSKPDATAKATASAGGHRRERVRAGECQVARDREAVSG